MRWSRPIPIAAMRVKAVFDAAARSYDRARRQLVPCFDDFYGAVLELLPFEPGASLRIADLGAGTGLLSLFVSQAFPQVRLTLLDFSDRMLERARVRFASQTDRFEFVVADYAREPLPGHFDAVVSALSIHHLEDCDKAALFHRIHQALQPGGVFVNADQMRGETPELDARYREVWRRQARERGVTDADLAQAQRRMATDRTATLEAQLRWLEEAGFQQVHCWYKQHMFAVYAGRREASAPAPG